MALFFWLSRRFSKPSCLAVRRVCVRVRRRRRAGLEGQLLSSRFPLSCLAREMSHQLPPHVRASPTLSASALLPCICPLEAYAKLGSSCIQVHAGADASLSRGHSPVLARYRLMYAPTSHPASLSSLRNVPRRSVFRDLARASLDFLTASPPAMHLHAPHGKKVC